MIEAAQQASATFAVKDYDLAATLCSGQAFRWEPASEGWVGVIGRHWVHLTGLPGWIRASSPAPVKDWSWLTDYLQLQVDLPQVVKTFPSDLHMQSALDTCWGLRLLRQNPWECLASFIISSTKQIVQIRQIVSLLCSRFGEPVPVLPGYPQAYTFPTAHRLAEASEAELRACKMGFRAPYLLETARLVSSSPALLELRHLDTEHARRQLLQLPGVGPKIADCVLLFAYGFQTAFPVDVWIARVLRDLYFPRRCMNLTKLNQFARDYFGPFGGYAQQYLFHYIRITHQKSRTPTKRNMAPGSTPPSKV